MKKNIRVFFLMLFSHLVSEMVRTIVASNVKSYCCVFFCVTSKKMFILKSILNL
jgi:hypothetical protein